MAQYKRNFYASTLYGRIRAFYGEYETAVFDAQEKFSYNVNANITAQLPSTFYSGISSEFRKPADGGWTVRGTDLFTRIANKPVELLLSGDVIEVSVRLQNQGTQSIVAKLYREEQVSPEVYEWVEKQSKTINTLSTVNSNQVIKTSFDSFGFGEYKLTLGATNTEADAIIAGVSLRTTHVDVLIRASGDGKTWTAYEKMPLTYSLVSGKSYSVTGKSVTKYSNVRYVQGKLILLSSDNTTSPEVERIELRSDDSNQYEMNGEYMIQVDMGNLAATLGTSFKQVSKIRWSENVPANTEMLIRSSSSRDNTFWGPITAPYKKNTKRLRLDSKVASDKLTYGPINEGERFLNSKTVAITKWDTKAYMPKDTSDVSITYDFLDKNGKVIQNITRPDISASKNITFSPQVYYIRISLTKGSNRGTPVVDMIDVYQDIEFQQKRDIVNKEISSVDSDLTGIKSLQKIRETTFNSPAGTTHIPYNANSINKAVQRYTLIDNTKRPNDVMVSLNSPDGKTTTSLDSNVIGKVYAQKPELGQTSGVKRHYQYGSGMVQYLNGYERELDSTFTPSLKSNLRYEYYVMNGWPDEYHKVVGIQTMNDIASIYQKKAADIVRLNPKAIYNKDLTLIPNQSILLPNDFKNSKVSLKFSNNTSYTEVSSHNKVLSKSVDRDSDTILVNVATKPVAGYVDWVSEEKIYNGVINPNGTREEFIRTQHNSSSMVGFYRYHVASREDTWESVAAAYGINIDDLQTVNSGISIYDLKAANEDIEIIHEDDIITIPPNVILPALAPEAIFETDRPYEVSIIPDSVHIKDGQRIDASFIPINWSATRPPLKITYRESNVYEAELTRGADKNGMDVLPLSDVSRIISVKSSDGTVRYHEYKNNIGDYKLTTNYVDWSPSASGSLEPVSGTKYKVQYVRKEPDIVEVFLDTTYFEEVAADIVWRSPEVKIVDGICTPSQDFVVELPDYSSFVGYRDIYKNIGYVIEDNDLWIDTKLKMVGDTPYLIGTLNGKDPSKNWHPKINTGFYYLKEQEHYLYSEPLKTVLSEKELPVADGVEYTNGPTGIGALLLPNSQNAVKDSGFKKTNWKISRVFEG